MKTGLVFMLGLFAVVMVVESAQAKAPPCPVTVEAGEVFVPTEVYDVSEAVPHVLVRLSNNSLYTTKRLVLGMEVSWTVETVGGSKKLKEVVPVPVEDIVLELLSTRETSLRVPRWDQDPDTELGDIVVLEAVLANGATCKAGVMDKPVPCTSLVPQSVLERNAAELICLMDPTLEPRQKLAAEKHLSNALGIKPDPKYCPVGLQLYGLLQGSSGREEGLRKAMSTALGKCPALVRQSAMLTPDLWRVWPCPGCLEACTGATASKAKQAEVEGDAVLPYMPCVTACSRVCTEAEFAKVKTLPESLRQMDYTGAITPRPSRPGSPTIFGIDTGKPATEALGALAVVSKEPFAQVCTKANVKCFVLKEVTPTANEDGEPAVVEIRAVVLGEKLALLSFSLVTSGLLNDADTAIALASKQLGKPDLAFMGNDMQAEYALFGGDPHLPNLVVARWNWSAGVAMANVSRFNPYQGEGHGIELIFVNTSE